jgi:hypothetical protein
LLKLVETLAAFDVQNFELKIFGPFACNLSLTAVCAVIKKFVLRGSGHYIDSSSCAMRKAKCVGLVSAYIVNCKQDWPENLQLSL